MVPILALRGFRFHWADHMNMNLTPDDRLEILQTADGDRVWNTLDDERVCLQCKETITGRQIVIRRSQPGGFVLHCPTPDCASTVEDWLYLTHISLHDARPVKRRGEMDFANW